MSLPDTSIHMNVFIQEFNQSFVIIICRDITYLKKKMKFVTKIPSSSLHAEAKGVMQCAEQITATVVVYSFIGNTAQH